MIEIRKAKVSEAAEIGRLWKNFMVEHDSNIIRKNKKAKAQLARHSGAHKLFVRYMERCIRSRNALVNVAVDKGKIVAYNLLRIEGNIPIFKFKKLGHFADIYVSKPYRSQRVSSQFKDIGLAWFKSRGIKCVSLKVYPGNVHAMNIYKKWGFFANSIDMRMEL